jgi:hypothetical protein
VTNELTHFLRLLRPRDAGEVQDVFPSTWRRALLERLVDARANPSVAPRHRAPSRSARARQSKVKRRLRLVPALGVIVALASAAGLLASGSAIAPSTAAGAVVFHTSGQGDVIATVKDPFAAQNQLNEAFAQHGFDITVDLVPVSASLVGTVIYTSEGDSAGMIQPLRHGSCLNGGGSCAIGVKIHAGFTGHGYVTLGRPARPGEAYASQASAFAQGEPLHCSHLLGASVANAAGRLEARGLTVEWRGDSPDGTSHSYVLEAAPLGSYVWEAVMATSGKAIVWTEPKPWPADSLHGAQFNQGC